MIASAIIFRRDRRVGVKIRLFVASTGDSRQHAHDARRYGHFDARFSRLPPSSPIEERGLAADTLMRAEMAFLEAISRGRADSDCLR